MQKRKGSSTTVEEVKSQKLPEYDQEELRKHMSDDDCWILVGDYIYDVTKFVKRHPGGDFIRQGYGRDATVLFESSHPLSVREKVLPKYRIGTYKRDKANKSHDYNYESAFYKVLRGRVEEYFQKNNFSPQFSFLLYFQTLYAIVGFITFYSIALWTRGNPIFCFLTAWFFTQIGIKVMHDGNHGAFSRYPVINKIAGLSMDVLGASSYVWKHEHNIGHHQWTNTLDDPDASAGVPFIRFHPSQKWKWHHQFQHFYTWFFYCGVSLKWYLSDIVNVYTRTYRGIPMYKPSTFDLAVVIISKIQIVGWLFGIPVMLLGWQRGIMIPFICASMVGFFFAMHFAPTHLADDVIFPEEFKNEKDWAKLQIMTTSNYAMNSWFATWCSAGLNYQIEHHLFPTIAHTYYPKIAPIVQRTCKEYNVPYYAHPTYFSAVKHHFNHLKRMGTSPDKAVEYRMPEVDWSQFGL